MKAYLMFQSMPAESSRAIADWLRDTEKEVFKATLSSLAAQRRLRPIFVARKTKAEQAAWVVEQLKSKLNEAVGENLLQIWLMKGRSAMLVTFLDSLGIPHDGNGGIEGDTPATLDPARVKAGVEALLAAHPATEVAVYLNLFQLQQPGGWPELQAVLDADPKLHFA
ncbi:MAG: hypothetical protein V4726_16330 [Verrucomicrobiota bacterium]